MNISVRSSRSALSAIGIVSAAALVAVLLAQARPPRRPRSAAHGGAGAPVPRRHRLRRPGLRPQLQPVRPGPPLVVFVRGGMYEPLVITTPAGGGREYKWLAESYAWSKDGEDADAQHPPRRQVDGRQAAHRGRRRLQPHRRQAGPDDGHPRRVPRGNEHRLRPAEGQYKVLIKLKTRDSEFVVGEPERDLRRPEARLLEGRRHQQVPQPEPGRLGPVRAGVAGSARSTTSSRRTRATGARARRRSRASSTSRRPRTTRRCCRSSAARPTGRTTSSRTSRRRTSRRTRSTTTPSTRRRRTRSR